MKYNRFFRIVTVAIILSLLMLAIPVTPVLAATVTISPDVGKIGDKINIEGKDFGGGEGLKICFSSQQADVGDKIDIDVTTYDVPKRVVTYGLNDPNQGTFATTFHVPSALNDGEDVELVHGGNYYIYIADETNDIILTVDKFTVIGIATINPDEGPVGTRVTIEGVAFEDKEDISMQYDGVNVPIASGDRKTDSAGAFTCKIDIPASTAGDHTITAIVKEVEGAITFTVVPKITIDPSVGGANDEVTVTGTGFGGEFLITITFDGNEMDISGDEETDEYGSFVSTFIVPSGVGQGTYEIGVEDEDGNSAEAEFSITASLSLSAGATTDSPGYVGMPLTITGTNFRANWPITITYASEPVTFTTQSLADGSFSYPITVPPSEKGVHIITATDGFNTAETRFFMESTPPTTPEPLLPALDTQAESKTHFDWEDAADDSQPVTYDLQVATDADFTALVVDRTGLTASAYTLTEDEELEKTGEEAPYYWHVKAVDAASNPGDWSSASTFYVGSTFHMPGWLLYTLIAIGAIALLIFGIWIGRKLTSREEYYY